MKTYGLSFLHGLNIKCNLLHWTLFDKSRKVVSTVFTRISAAALIQFFAPQVRRLFEGVPYSRAALI